jgi:hypothetical protein
MSITERCQESTRRVISASRRTDLPARFPEWLSRALAEESAGVLGPSGHAFAADLRPCAVHTIVLWSKDFSSLLEDRHGLRTLLRKYDQVYLQFTVTGLGGTRLESGVLPPEKALAQVGPLAEAAGHPRRVSLRFDPVVWWNEAGRERTNLSFFEVLAPRAAAEGITDIRFSLAQWYGKARRRAAKLGFDLIDPPLARKLEAARHLAGVASSWKLALYSCSQNFLTEVPGIRASACIDGQLLSDLHPGREPASRRKDRSQRPECGCTESLDIGSYAQACPHACLYCYANPGTGG